MSGRSERKKRKTSSEPDVEQIPRIIQKYSSKSSCEKFTHTFVCSIDDFSKLPHGVGQPTYLAPFTMQNHKFKVLIFPGGIREKCKDCVSIFLELCEPSKPEFKFSLAIRSKTDVDLIEYSYLYAVFERDNNKPHYGCSEFIERSKLLNEVLKFTNDRLTVTVKIHDFNVTQSLYQLEKFHSLKKFINNKQCSDVQIIVGNETIHAHKIILMNGSEVFASMLTHDSIESREGVIRIEDIDHETMKQLIRYIYIGEVRNLHRVAERLLIAADKYGIELLKNKCSKLLCKALSKSNVLELLSYADTYNVEDLRQEAITFFKNNKKDVIKMPRFKESLERIGMDLIAELLALSSNSSS